MNEVPTPRGVADAISTDELNRRLRSLFESMDESFYLVEIIRDHEGKAVDVFYLEENPAAVELVGVSAIGKQLSEINAGFDREWLTILGRVANSGKSERFEKYSPITKRRHSYHIFRGGAHPDHVGILSTDITDRDQARDALRESETRHRLLIDSWAQAVWETDPEGVVVKDSPSWRAYTGQTLEQWLGYGWLDAIHPDDREHAQRQWLEAMATKSLVNSEFRMRAPGGTWRWTNIRAAPVLDSAGSIEKWSGMNIDIDARKRAEEALRESDERYRTLFDTIDEGFTIMEAVRDDTGRVVDVIYRQANQAWARLFGFEIKLGRKASELFSYPADAPWIETWNQVLETGEPVRQEQHVVSTDRWYNVRFSRIGSAGSNLIAAVFHDITERKRGETILRESEERQAFLLKLSDALRGEPDADGVANRAIQMLLEHLQLDRCYITFYRPDEDAADFPYQVGNDSVPPLPAEVRLSDFPEAYEQVREKTFVIEDDFERRGLSQAEKRNRKNLGMRAMVASTVRTADKVALCSMAAVSSHPRRWTVGEIATVEDAAERTWAAMERARADVALRESEQKYRTLFEKMGQGYSLNEVVRDSEGHAIDLRYLELNPAFERLTGASLREARGQLASDVFPGLDRYWVQICDQAVTSGTIESVEHELTPNGRWYRSNFYPIGGDLVLSLYDDITDQKRAELALRQSEERNSFLLKLSDALRALTDSAELERTAVRMLGEALGVNRVFYATIDEDEAGWSVQHDYAHGVPGVIGRFPMSEFQAKRLDGWKAGRMTSVIDSETDPSFTDSDRAAYAEFGARAAISVPLVKGDRFAALLAVNQTEPRQWTEAELTLTREAAERIWTSIERARAEQTLREREKDLSRVQRIGRVGGLDIDIAGGMRSRRSPEYLRLHGLTPDHAEEVHQDWLGRIHPDDRERADGTLTEALDGDGSSYEGEYRIIRPSDGEVRWILARADIERDGSGKAVRLVGAHLDVTEQKATNEALRQSERHANLLLAELQHRVRNTLAVIRSIIRRTADRSSTVDEMMSHLEGRLNAFARAQTAMTRIQDAGVDLNLLVIDEMRAVAAREGRHLRIRGPEVVLRSKAAELMSLAIHELATNSVKYGALSNDGRIDVAWSVESGENGKLLDFRWRESGVIGAQDPVDDGFGHEMLERTLPYELNAETKIDFTKTGLHFRMKLPLTDQIVTD